MIFKMPPKGSPGKKKKAKRGMNKAKKTLITMPTSDSGESQTILIQGALEGHLAGRSDKKDGHGGRGRRPARPARPAIRDQYLKPQ